MQDIVAVAGEDGLIHRAKLNEIFAEYGWDRITDGEWAGMGGMGGMGGTDATVGTVQAGQWAMGNGQHS